VTGSAAANIELPGWLAVIEQVPPAINATVVPDTVQTLVEFEVNVTESPEVAEAISVKGGVAALCVVRAPNVMVWDFSEVVIVVSPGPTVTADGLDAIPAALTRSE
jgi:hypothetical protein